MLRCAAAASGLETQQTMQRGSLQLQSCLNLSRKCETRQSPDETRQHDGLCPVCGKAVTVGVMNRVDELSDRPEGFRPDGAAKHRSLVPLQEVIAEIRGVGEKSKKVQQAYEGLIARIGPELYILEQAPIEDIRSAGAPMVAEAVERMREGQVICEAGYDGEYGRIHLFEEQELQQGACVSLLFDIPPEPEKRPSSPRPVASSPTPPLASPPPRVSAPPPAASLPARAYSPGAGDASERAGRRRGGVFLSLESPRPLPAACRCPRGVLCRGPRTCLPQAPGRP